jgi:hypothetical protein
MIYKDYDREFSCKKKVTGREPQGGRRQNELIGGKPPVVKYYNSDAELVGEWVS